MFKTGDIILNFRRFVVYRYNTNESVKYNKDFFSCRLAVGSEIQKFIEYGKDIVKFKEIGLCKKNTKKDFINIQITLRNSNLFYINDLITKNKFNDYTELFNYLGYIQYTNLYT